MARTDYVAFDSQQRETYGMNRLAFVTAIFSILEKDELILYKAGCHEDRWRPISVPLRLMLDSKEAAMEDLNCEAQDKYKISYLIKLPIPSHSIIMSCIETEEISKEGRYLVLGRLDCSI